MQPLRDALQYINDIEFGTTDDDFILLDSKNSFVMTFSGDDIVYLGSTGTDIISTGRGDDFVVGTVGEEYFFLGSGNDIIFADDFGNGANTSSGNDFVHGGRGNDFIFSGEQDEDVLVGGLGRDVFAFVKNNSTTPDTILDFTAGQDFFVFYNAGGSAVLEVSDFKRSTGLSADGYGQLQGQATFSGMTGSAQVEVELMEVANGDLAGSTFLAIDYNDDGTVDDFINITGYFGEISLHNFLSVDPLQFA